MIKRRNRKWNWKKEEKINQEKHKRENNERNLKKEKLKEKEWS